jgi:hypothetical protein
MRFSDLCQAWKLGCLELQIRAIRQPPLAPGLSPGYYRRPLAPSLAPHVQPAYS